MQTILVPTDFRESSLDCVPALCRKFFHGEELRLIFVHLFKLSDSITDLLMLSRRSKDYEYVSSAFHQRCRELQQEFPAIGSITTDFIYGSTVSFLKNYLEAQNVTFILEIEDRIVMPLNKSSLDPFALVKRTGYRSIRLSRADLLETRPVPAPAEEHEFLVEPAY